VQHAALGLFPVAVAVAVAVKVHVDDGARLPDKTPAAEAYRCAGETPIGLPELTAN
jgi:hypothetical protein